MYAVFLLAISMFFIGNLKESNAKDCDDQMREMGEEMKTFAFDVSHGIHSIGVEHLKFYFNAPYSRIINIPTMNYNFSGPHIIYSPPFLSNDPRFVSLNMKELDFILTNNNDPNNFYVRSLSHIEKMTHAAHMNEIWTKTKPIYEKIALYPPDSELCSCLTNEKENGIIEELVENSKFFRNFRPFELGEYPRLENSEDWKIWKNMIYGQKDHMISDRMTKNIAIYLFCKLNV